MHMLRQTGQRRLHTRMTFSQSLMVAGDGALKLDHAGVTLFDPGVQIDEKNLILSPQLLFVQILARLRLGHIIVCLAPCRT